MDIFSQLLLSQNDFKYTFIIKNTFYGILNSAYTCIDCHTEITTWSNFCKLEVQVMKNIDTSIQKTNIVSNNIKRHWVGTN